MRNILLLHLRERYRLSPKQIEQRTGIPLARYQAYENSPLLIPDTDIELLAALLRIKPGYLKTYCHQLEVFAHHQGLLRVKEERIGQLTRALKCKIRATPLAARKPVREAKRKPLEK